MKKTIILLITTFVLFAIACSVLQIKSNQALETMFQLNQSLEAELIALKEEKTIIKEVEDYFRVASEVYGVEYELLLAIAIHETGWFKSYAYTHLHNVGGIMNSKGDKLRTFESEAMGIMEFARLLKFNYLDKGLTTLEKIQPKYAPIGAKNDPKDLNRKWLPSTKSIYNGLKK